MSFDYRVTARFYEVDAAGVMFFARVFEYCHGALEDLMAAVMGDRARIFGGGPWGMPIVHTEADFQRPVRLGDELTVRPSVERIGKRSITFSYEVVSAGGEPHATAKTVHTFIDMKAFTPLEVPAELIEALEKHNLVP